MKGMQTCKDSGLCRCHYSQAIHMIELQTNPSRPHKIQLFDTGRSVPIKVEVTGRNLQSKGRQSAHLCWERFLRIAELTRFCNERTVIPHLGVAVIAHRKRVLRWFVQYVHRIAVSTVRGATAQQASLNVGPLRLRAGSSRAWVRRDVRHPEGSHNKRWEVGLCCVNA